MRSCSRASRIYIRSRRPPRSPPRSKGGSRPTDRIACASVPGPMTSSLTATVSDRFRSLRHRDFRLFWTGQLVSLMGTWMQTVAQGWLMHRLTESPAMLGMLGFAQFFPSTVFSLFAGVLADRMDKRRLLLITQSFAMVQAVAMALVVTLGIVQPWMILVLAFLLGTINAFDLPG